MARWILSGITRVSRYQKGKTKNRSGFPGARDSECQWDQLGHMQICTSSQTDNHASIPPLSFYRLDALPAAQPTASKHWRQDKMHIKIYKTLSQWRYLTALCVVYGIIMCLSICHKLLFCQMAEWMNETTLGLSCTVLVWNWGIFTK